MEHSITAEIMNFICKKIEESGMKKAIIGLSGGIDSTVIAYLTSKAIGPDNVYGMILPSHENENDINKQHALKITEILGIHYEIFNIENFIKEFLHTRNTDDKIRIGNFMARIRMCILYDKAKELNGLVIGTTNKTEYELGYFTKWGDGAVDIEPIADIYKTDVFKLAKLLKVPEEIINKSPSANLWDGQTDEEELGLSYEKIDRILQLLPDLKDIYFDFAMETIDKEGISINEFKLVMDIIKHNKHKTINIPSFVCSE